MTLAKELQIDGAVRDGRWAIPPHDISRLRGKLVERAFRQLVQEGTLDFVIRRASP